MGYFYPPPPTFVGGKQPYAPRLGQVQSGAAPDNPPIRNWVALGIILSSWVQPTVALPAQAKIAPVIAGTAAAAHVPLKPRQLFQVLDHWYVDRVTVIVLASPAPGLAESVEPDDPPQRSWVNFDTILAQWTPKPGRIPVPPGIGSQSSTAAAPDTAPSISTAIRDLLYASWIPKPWWPLPDLTWQVPPSAAAPDQPQPVSRVNQQLVLSHWHGVHVGLPTLRVLPGALLPITPIPPEVIDSPVNTNATTDVPSNYEICDRTGFRVPAGTLRREWNGAMVRPQSWESRHPQEFVRSRPEHPKGSPRPEQTDTFIADDEQIGPEDL